MIVFFYSTSSFLQNTIEEEKIEIRKFENLQNKLKRRRWGLESLEQKRKNTGLDLPLPSLVNIHISCTKIILNIYLVKFSVWIQKSDNEKYKESAFEYMVSKGWCFKI